MLFLADESCDFSVVRALRDAGHDVIAVCEVSPRLNDADVINTAVKEGRILLTEDKDFGWLVYVAGHEQSGVIFIRFPTAKRKSLPKIIQDLVEKKQDQLRGSFIVVQPGRIRISHHSNQV